MIVFNGGMMVAGGWAPNQGRITGTVYDKASPTNAPVVERVFCAAG